MIPTSPLVRISAAAALFLATPHQEPFIVALPSEHRRTSPMAPLPVGDCPQPSMVQSAVRIRS
jgi:hypothetical protein